MLFRIYIIRLHFPEDAPEDWLLPLPFGIIPLFGMASKRERVRIRFFLGAELSCRHVRLREMVVMMPFVCFRYR